MPRSNRIDIANGLYHVTQRGLERRNIVLNEDDRSHWWRLFDRVACRFRWRIFAVALLDNHFHLYLRTPDPNLSEGMRDLNGGYASSFNQRHEREGPLYQGRFKSVLVENDSHSWELSRYVHLNPYRAGLTHDPFQYRWSSYHFYLNGSRKPDWLDTQTVLAEFAGTAAGARLAYKRFVEAGMQTAPNNPLDAAEATGILGSAEFIHGCQEWLTPLTACEPTLDGVLASVCTEFAKRARAHEETDSAFHKQLAVIRKQWR
ncbi:MAG: transposase [Planctomycetota bacterium]